MPQIEIDSEVFSYLKAQALPYEEPTPNHTLRRLFGLTTVDKEPKGKKSERSTPKRRTRKPRTSLRLLVKGGYLQEGQQLFLHTYRGARIEGSKANVDKGNLRHDGERYSMSALARDLLQAEGFESDSVRGPAHWHTANGVSVRDLWNQYLRNGRETN